LHALELHPLQPAVAAESVDDVHAEVALFQVAEGSDGGENLAARASAARGPWAEDLLVRQQDEARLGADEAARDLAAHEVGEDARIEEGAEVLGERALVHPRTDLPCGEQACDAVGARRARA